jgi:hypothetical protein
MTKRELIEMIEKYAPDTGEIAMGGWWYREDIESWAGELTDNEWDRFVEWFEKYQDSSADADEALYYARKESDDAE